MKLNSFVKIMWTVTIFSGAVLLIPRTSAENDITSSVNIGVNSNCTISSQVTTPHTATMQAGSIRENIGSTTIKAVCNDSEGYEIYAIGYSDRNGDGDTNMYSADGSQIIPTGTAISGNTSAWSMKLAAVSGTYTPTIDYAGDYAEVPSESTRVAHMASHTDADEGSSITTTYKVYVAPTQNAGTYTGKVKYSLAHSHAPAASTMQDFTCSSLASGASTQLQDSRDGKEYTVAKLADGNCWMTQNLALGSHASMTLTPADSDVTKNWTLPASVEEGNWEGSYDDPEFYAWASDYDDSTTKYGNYYNWSAATAGTGTSSLSSGNAPESICPKGWRLPTGDSSGEFMNLMTLYGWSDYELDPSIFTGTPLSFVFSGYYYYGVVAQGVSGHWWSSTAGGSDGAYDLYGYGGYVYPASFGIKDRDFSVRCLARDMRTYTINYDANGGTGAPASQTFTSESENFIYITHSTPTSSDPSKPVFLGWSTNQYATSADYKPGDKFTFESGTTSITLYAVYGTGVTLTFDANGGNFNGSTTNVLTYSTPTTVHYPEFQGTTSSTTDATGTGDFKSSIDDGSQYASNSDYYQDITAPEDIPLPLHVKIYYATESTSWDWVCLFAGDDYEPGSKDDCSGSESGKLGGGGQDKTEYAKVYETDINSHTARIYFRSDGSVNSYGYWAEMTGGGDVTTQEKVSGDYISEPSPRTGLGFLGWSTSPTATTPDWTYDPNAKVMEDTKVYAVWVEAKTFDEAFAEAGKSKQDGYYKMQDMTAEICDTVQPAGLSTQLIDTRDGGIYTVSKLRDGKCWMTENLALGGEDAINLTPSDTDITKNFTLPVSEDDIDFSEYIGGQDIYLNAPLAYKSPDTDDVYYTMGAAAASSYPKIADPDMEDFDPDVIVPYYTSLADATASESICPKGWRLPKNDASNFVRDLLDANGLTTPPHSPFNPSTDSDFYGMIKEYIGENDWSGVDDGVFHKGTDRDIFNSLPNISLPGVLDASKSDILGYGDVVHLASSSAFGNIIEGNDVQVMNFMRVPILTSGEEVEFTRSIRCVARNIRTYTIHYEIGAGTGGPTSSQSIVAEDNAQVTITAEEPQSTSPNLYFLGWTTTQGGSTAEYKPGETFTFETGITSVTLYAVYGERQGLMQDMTGSYCNSLTTDQTITLTDSRDDQEYTVAKLRDGKCWMTKNLNLGDDEPITLTPSNTDITRNFTLPASTDEWYALEELETYIGEIDYILNAPYLLKNEDRTETYYSTGATGAFSYPHIEDSVFESGDINSYQQLYSATASESICPKGWRLPKHDVSSLLFDLLEAQGGSIPHDSFNPATDSEFYNLLNAYYGTDGWETGEIGEDNIIAYYYREADENLFSDPLSYNLPGWFDYDEGAIEDNLLNLASASAFGALNIYDDNYVELFSIDNFDSSISRTVRCVARNPKTYTINYEIGEGTGGPAAHQTLTAEGNGISTKLSNIKPTSTDPTKNFSGWSTEPNSDTPDYNAGDTYTFPSGSTSVTLYAVYGYDMSTIDDMQEITPSICASSTTDQTYTLTDSRDDEQYTVAKLRDGNCWMTQNLALGGINPIDLDSTDSDITSSFTLPASVEYSDWEGDPLSPELFAYSEFADDSETKYGNYYNWQAATAGSVDESIMSNLTVSQSICPKGWKLPSQGENSKDGQFYRLLEKYMPASDYIEEEGISGWTDEGREIGTTARAISNPVLGYTYGGFYDGELTTIFGGEIGYSGGWWSNGFMGVIDGPAAFGLAIAMIGDSESYVIPAFYDDISNGRTIRCVARNPKTYTINYEIGEGTGGPVAHQTFTLEGDGASTKLSTSIPNAPSGKAFAGWATSSTATEAEINAGGTYTFPSRNYSATLYAVYAPIVGDMQDMNAETCDNLSLEQTVFMTDTRTNKNYSVKKLRDGNCWMTQNLALGGASPMTLTSADSDVDSNFTLPASTEEWYVDADSEEDMINTPQMIHDPNYTEGDPDGEYYYNWNAATASTGTYDLANKDTAESSICPKGWRLPIANDENGRDFGRLLDAYNNPDTVFNATYAGGYFEGVFEARGMAGAWQSNTAYSNSDLIALFMMSGEYDYSENSKDMGLSVRCVARNPKTYTINYEIGDGTGGPVAHQSFVLDGDGATMKLSNITPTPLSGKVFMGWSTSSAATEATIQPGDYYTFPSGDKTLTLYAVYIQIIGNMQDMNSEVCSSLSTNQTVGMIDSRDGKQYTVAKLADGNCWMTQNLAFNLVAGATLTPSDSDITRASWTIPTTTETRSTITDWTCSSDEACAAAKSYSYGDRTYGNYYSWYAATANSGTYSMTSSDVPPAESICPKGWRLPSYKQYDKLLTGSGISVSNLLKQPVSLVLGGYVEKNYEYGGSSSYAVYNTATVNDEDFIRTSTIGIQSSSIRSYDYEKDDGLTMRCVARNPKTYTINYEIGEGTGGPVAHQSLIFEGDGASTKLSDTKPTSTDPTKSFLGWSTTPDSDTPDYNAGDTYTFPSGSTSVTFYAVYGDAAGPMQNYNCANLSTGQTTKLKDTRDGNTYDVVKLSTGQCWMQENLRLGKGSGTMTLTPDNTNITSNYTLPAAQTSGSTSWSSDTTGKVYATNNTTYGNYYNWYAATAGTGTSSMSSGNASGSICPKGWRLPTGGSSGEFNTLNTTYNSGSTSSDSGLLADPLNLVRAGFYYSGVNYQGSYGYYWSSTVSSSSFAYFLGFFSDYVVPAASNDKYYGFSVRCISAS